MAERFVDRIDPSILDVGRAKVVEKQELGFLDDDTVGLLFKAPEGLVEEAIDYLKANQLVYTDVDVDYRHLEGTYRTVTISYDTKLGGIVQTLSKGLYSSLDWDAARILTNQRKAAGTNDELFGGDEEQNFVAVEFPYIDPSNQETVVQSVPTTKDDIFGLTGTWYLIDDTSKREDDGTYTVTALYSNTATFAVEGCDSWGVPSGSKLYQFSGVPKQLAQGICDIYNVKGNSVYPTYSFENGLVNIRVNVSDFAEIIIDGVEMVNSCKYNTTSTYYFGADTVRDLPPNSLGIIYRRGSVYQGRNGKYNYYIEKRTSNAIPSSGTSEASASQITTNTTNTNARSLTPITSAVGHIKRRRFSVNDDCTFDETIEDTTPISQPSTNTETSAARTSIEIKATEASALSAAPSLVGTIAVNTNTPTPSGKFNTSAKVITIVDQQITDVSTDNSFFNEVTEDSHTSSSNIEIADKGVIGTRYSVSNSPTEEGRYRTSKKTITSIPRDRVIEDPISISLYEKSVETRKKNQESTVAISDLGQGHIVSKRESDNNDGTFDVSIVDTESIDTTPIEDDVVVSAEYIEAKQTKTKNSRSVGSIGSASPGHTLSKNISINKDGTFDVTTNDEHKKPIESMRDFTVKLDEAVEVKRTLLSRQTSVGEFPEVAQGESLTGSKRVNEDGSIDVDYSVEIESDLTATDAGTFDRHVSDYAKKIEEEHHSASDSPLGIVAPAIRTVTEVVNQKKANGLFSTVKRTVSSILQKISLYTAEKSKSSLVKKVIVLNASPSDASAYEPQEVVGHINTRKMSPNPDGTYNIETTDVQEINQTSTSEVDSPLHIMTEVKNSASTSEVSAAGSPGVISTAHNSKTKSGLTETDLVTDRAIALTGVEVTSVDSPMMSGKDTRYVNNASPIGASSGANGMGTASYNINKYGLYDGQTSTRTPVTNYSKSNISVGGNALSSSEMTIVKNATSSSISSVTGKDVSARVSINEFGLLDITSVEEEGIAYSGTPCTISDDGIFVRKATIFRNASTAPTAGTHEEISGLSYNKYGKFDYTLIVTSLSGTPSYSYTYDTPRQSGWATVHDKVAWQSHTQVYTATGEKIDSGGNKEYLLSPKNYITEFLVSKVAQQYYSTYTISAEVFETPSAAGSFINGANGGGSVASFGNGWWIGKKTEITHTP